MIHSIETLSRRSLIATSIAFGLIASTDLIAQTAISAPNALRAQQIQPVQQVQQQQIQAAPVVPSSQLNAAKLNAPISNLSDLLARPDNEVVTDSQGKSMRLGDLKREINSKRHLAQTKIEPVGAGANKTSFKLKRQSPELAKYESFRASLQSAVNSELATARCMQPNPPAPTPPPSPAAQIASGKLATSSATLGANTQAIGVQRSQLAVGRTLCPSGGLSSVAGSRSGRFETTPKAGVMVRGCFAEPGQTPTEIRINGQFAGGHITIPIQSKGADFAFGNMPDLRGVTDQNVTLSVKYSNGTSSNEKQGRFVATRETFQLDPASVPGFTMRTNAGAKRETPGGNILMTHGTGTDNQTSGSDIYVPALADGFEVTNFWGSWSGDGADFVWSSDGFPQVNWRTRRSTSETVTYIPYGLVGFAACVVTGGGPIILDRRQTATDRQPCCSTASKWLALRA